MVGLWLGASATISTRNERRDGAATDKASSLLIFRVLFVFQVRSLAKLLKCRLDSTTIVGGSGVISGKVLLI